MRSRVTSWLAWSLAALSVGVFLASFPLYILARSAPVPVSWDANLGLGSQLASALLLAFPIVGALIASRHPRNPIGWIFLADGLLWLLTGLMDYYSIYGVASPGSVPFPVGVAGVNNFLWVPAVGLLGTYAIMLFPDGRLPSRRWRPLAWLSGAVIVVLSVGVAISPGPLLNLGGIRNPFGLELPPWVEVAFFIFLPLLPLCMLASVGSLVSRYRRAIGEERQQIKWISFAASVVGVTYLIAMVTSFAFPSGAWMAAGSPLWLDLVAYAALASFTGVPIAVGFAVLRYRLYDIDILINRTLVYGSLTAMLAAVYLGGVATTQAIYSALTRQEEQPQLAIVVSTLVIAALFNPLRSRIQGFIDRRFYRRKYDAAKTLAAFSSRLREEPDLERLGEDLVGVVTETMQPSHVSLVLRPDPEPREKKRAAIREAGHDE
jgi:MFS family permease